MGELDNVSDLDYANLKKSLEDWQKNPDDPNFRDQFIKDYKTLGGVSPGSSTPGQSVQRKVDVSIVLNRFMTLAKTIRVRSRRVSNHRL